MADSARVKPPQGFKEIDEGPAEARPGGVQGGEVEGDAVDEVCREKAGGRSDLGFEQGREVMDTNEAGVMQGAKELELAANSGEEVWGVGAQELEGDLGMAQEVEREPGRGGAALAQGAKELVAVEQGGQWAGSCLKECDMEPV